MLLKQEQISPCELELELKAEPEVVDKAVDQAYKHLGKSVSIPGFRKGKAPRAILERFLDKDHVSEHVVDEVMQDLYKASLDEAGIEPFAPATVKSVEFDLDKRGEPMTATLSVPLAPKVELGEYVGLTVERTVHTVSDEDVSSEIGRMMERHSTAEPVFDRPVGDGDQVLIEMKDSSSEDEPREMTVEVGDNLPGFDDGIRGMSIGDEKVIEVTYPDDAENEEIRGQKKSFWVRVIEIRNKVVPELTDEWVKATLAGPEHPEHEEDSDHEHHDHERIDTAEKVRAKFRENMEKAAQDVADLEVRHKLAEQIVGSATVDFPEVMLEEAITSRVRELVEELKQRKVSLEDYLAYKKMSYEELRESYREEEERGLRSSLVFREIISKEDMKVEDGDVDAQIAEMAEERRVPTATMRAYVEKTDGVQDIRNRALRKKLLDFLVAASNIKHVTN